MSDKKLYDSFHISTLLVGKLNNTLTATEEAELEMWLDKSVSNREILEKLLNESIRSEDIGHLREFDAETALRDVKTRIDDNQYTGLRSGKLRSYAIRIAAAATVLVTLSVGFWLYKDKPRTEQLSFHVKKTEITPGVNKAILVLSNGNKIDLQAARSGNIANQGGITVSKQADGKIDYQGAGSAAAQSGTESELNTLYVPKGGQYQLTLPDGTHVWLNAASSLTYPVAFKGKERRVKLTGEAYFEVAKNPDKPFQVNVGGKQTVEVLGTHFDIKAYVDDSDIRTALLEGSVKVSSKSSNIIIKPGQMAINNLKEPLTIRNADLDEVMGWKNGLFVFNDERIEDVLKIAARWYDVDVEYHTDAGQKKLRGIVSKYKNITELLDNITITSGIHYKIEGRRVILMN
ncbi:FecR domain-containing protein [Mucilaginibacter sabulilitoris]|uniref:FecR domain-containing protein n=1 Tax=Mucilaginibacter sabulilitoris TaxID=1173583 RepID=A0ABZ0TKN0_9SPHI|nr:FecR domain-containing protein [Mucilaginibacter sabulilitoris]WPU93734.1 FecR domain-containing protein [Mucilaginibacter sabulilitoris]